MSSDDLGHKELCKMELTTFNTTRERISKTAIGGIHLRLLGDQIIGEDTHCLAADEAPPLPPLQQPETLAQLPENPQPSGESYGVRPHISQGRDTRSCIGYRQREVGLIFRAEQALPPMFAFLFWRRIRTLAVHRDGDSLKHRQCCF